MAKKVGRPSWFKMFLSQKTLIDSVPDETAGRALKAVFAYFDNREIPELDPFTFAVFSTIQPYVDEAYRDYENAVKAGEYGAEKRWGR